MTHPYRPLKVDKKVDTIPVLWFDSSGRGPDELALELHPFPAELDGKIPAFLGIRVRAGDIVIGASALVDGGFNLGREQATELHRQLGAWLGAPGPELTCFSSSPCRIPAGSASCIDCGFPRAYVNPASYREVVVELGDVIVDGVPMLTVDDIDRPLGTVAIVRRRSSGPVTPDNTVWREYRLPGYGDSPPAQQQPEEPRGPTHDERSPGDPEGGDGEPPQRV